MTTVAGAFCEWYWTGDEARHSIHRPVARSWSNATTKHLGSGIFGALLIAIVEFLRAILEWVDHHRNHHGENKAVKVTVTVAV
jgi:choline transporter-like protein 2/4/5